MRCQWPAFLLVSAFLCSHLAGCVPSKFPLSDAETSQIDEQLIGTWKLDADVFLVRRASAENTLEVVAMDAGQEAGTPSLLYTTQIDGQRYLSSEEIDRESGEKTYTIVRYNFVDQDTLRVCGLDLEVIGKAIQAKQLAGTVSVTKDERSGKAKSVLVVGALLEGLLGGGREPAPAEEKPVPVEETWHVALTDSPDQMARYLAAHADQCFPESEENVLEFQRKP